MRSSLSWASRLPAEPRRPALCASRRQSRLRTHQQLRRGSLWLTFHRRWHRHRPGRARSDGRALSGHRATRRILHRAFFLGLYGVSELLAALFPIDDGAEASTSGTIHNIVGNVSFFGFPISVILLSLGMGKDERWRSLRLPALALAGVVVLTVVLTMVGFNLGIGFGLTQRLANVAVLVWMLVVALRLRSMAQSALVFQPRVV